VVARPLRSGDSGWTSLGMPTRRVARCSSMLVTVRASPPRSHGQQPWRHVPHQAVPHTTAPQSGGSSGVTNQRRIEAATAQRTKRRAHPAAMTTPDSPSTQPTAAHYSIRRSRSGHHRRMTRPGTAQRRSHSHRPWRRAPQCLMRRHHKAARSGCVTSRWNATAEYARPSRAPGQRLARRIRVELIGHAERQTTRCSSRRSRPEYHRHRPGLGGGMKSDTA
jgi:hypothetical protein